MIFSGILILGEFLEEQFKKHFDILRQKQKELGVNLPPYPKPIFIGSSKHVNSMKTKPSSKAGDNTLLIQFESASISNYTFESITCNLNFKIYISTKHLVTLMDMTDVIMSLHNAPLNIHEHTNVFTEKGYVSPMINIMKARINTITNLDKSESSTQTDAFKFVIHTTFELKIHHTPTLNFNR